MHIVHNHNPHGPDGVNIPKLIVIHSMAEYVKDDNGDYVHATKFLEHIGYSEHAQVDHNGIIIRCLEDIEKAHHALGYNNDSLGLSALVEGKHNYGSFIRAIGDPYMSDDQYHSMVYQCQVWIAKYEIARVVRHSDISPGRKLDPGEGFPWEEFLKDIWRL